MLLLEEIVLQEKNRIENMIKLYESELSSLAHGTLVKKKIISKYIGKSEEKIAEIKEQLVRRHQIEIILKQLKAEHTLAKKYMEVSG